MGGSYIASMSSLDQFVQLLFWAPWLGLLVVLCPLLVLAFLWRIYPTWRLVAVACASLALSLLMLLVPLLTLGRGSSQGGGGWVETLQSQASLLFYFLALVDVLLLTLLAVDLVSVVKATAIEVTRQMLKSGSLGASQEVTLWIENRGTRKHRMIVRDDLPEYMVANPPEQLLELGPRKKAELTYQLKPNRRGAFSLERVHFKLVSQLGFWTRLFDKECKQDVAVYPNMQQLSEYAMLAKTNRLSLIGVRATRQVGQDNNFERLRDYTLDDNYKHMDWRATARRRKLTVKEFQQDKSQRIMFLLDCGRLMTNEYRGLSLLDYAMNSILMMSYVALQQGDSVGMMCFSDHIEKYVPLRGGPKQMNHVLHGLFDRFPRMHQSNFDEAFLYLSQRCRRRTLVVLITNVIDDITASQVTGYLSTLRPRHLPVLCLMRDRRVFEMADNPALEEEILYPSAAAAQLLLWRHELIEKVKVSGALVLDAFPDQLTSCMVNRYLEIKAKHML